VDTLVIVLLILILLAVTGHLHLYFRRSHLPFYFRPSALGGSSLRYRMRILVTGGAGFIGSHLIDSFVAAGHDTAIVDNFWERGGGRRSNVNPKAKLYDLDIRGVGLEAAFLEFSPDAVSHHAAQHSVAISTADPKYDAEVNILGLLNVLKLSVKHSVRKVTFASSAATYGTPQRLPIAEDHPQLPESPYGITKMAAEHYLRVFNAAHGLKYTALRYGNVFGPRPGASSPDSPSASIGMANSKRTSSTSAMWRAPALWRSSAATVKRSISGPGSVLP
jgi:nucleoside-diphosphate-sugar epimerase